MYSEFPRRRRFQNPPSCHLRRALTACSRHCTSEDPSGMGRAVTVEMVSSPEKTSRFPAPGPYSLPISPSHIRVPGAVVPIQRSLTNPKCALRGQRGARRGCHSHIGFPSPNLASAGDYHYFQPDSGSPKDPRTRLPVHTTRAERRLRSRHAQKWQRARCLPGEADRPMSTTRRLRGRSLHSCCERTRGRPGNSRNP